MLEYVFFHVRPFEEFVAYLHELGLQPGIQAEEDSWEASLPEDLDDELSEKIEERYDQLMELNQQLFDAEQPEGYHTAGVVVNLAGGETVYAQVDPLLLGKIMEVLTPEEFGDVVNAIVDAVEQPDERTLCQRMRDQAQ
ncbi:hypothetical protein [Thiolapillus brandeum]|uniref:Uncharacterized protein n=1 Tax=Thiolapillus brandeum TaxID=1076588 RepID=A0A7U6JGU1_9GAMM|nr:hypothetical protein [Thiolapillus brandeum]BAO43731.1 conserved hypothetical protein [Thiolapillus brandeum]